MMNEYERTEDPILLDTICCGLEQVEPAVDLEAVRVIMDTWEFRCALAGKRSD